MPRKRKEAQADSHLDVNRRKSNMTASASECFCLSNNYHGDIFSVQDLAHLPVISSNVQIHNLAPVSKDAKLSPVSPQLWNLQTPEKRPGQDSHSSGNFSRRSWGFASHMPSPSKLIFSPNKQELSPSDMLSPNCIGEICRCCALLKNCTSTSANAERRIARTKLAVLERNEYIKSST